MPAPAYGPLATATMRGAPTPRGPIDARARAFLDTRRRLSAYHEAGHAVAAFVLGWGHNILAQWLTTNADGSAFFIDTPRGRRRLTDLGQLPERSATSLFGAPPMPDDEAARRAWCRVGGAIAWGGSVAENAVRAACGLPPLRQPAIEYSAGDWNTWTRYRDLSPEPRGEYALATKKMAKAAIAGHHRQVEGLANALLNWRLLSVAGCVTIWEKGALPARGIVGLLRLVPSRDALAVMPCSIAGALPFLVPA